MQAGQRRSSGRRNLHVGDHVRVRPAAEILATLDAHGARDDLPFSCLGTHHCNRLFCPRGALQFWREEWLERVTEAQSG